MKRTYFLLAAGLLCHAALAQTQPGATAFQPAQALGGARGGGGGALQPALRTEPGKPFSATVTTQTAQTLTDGTRLTQTTTMVEYRDAEGRVRTETTQPGRSPSEPVKIISIRDPVAGVTYRLDPARRSAIKLASPGAPALAAIGGGATRGGGGGGRGGVAPQATTQPAVGGVAVEGGGGRGRGTVAPEASAEMLEKYRLQAQLSTLQTALATFQETQATRTNPNDIVEDLGTIPVNGIAARGTRVTTVVPVGAIGNDREFRSINERWFSSDLNLLVKSVNTDPRFGTTTYELTNISRQAPDPSLFQVPADYTIDANGGGRGGR